MDLYSFGYDVWLRGFQPIPAHRPKPLFISVFGNRLELAPRMGAPNWNSRYSSTRTSATMFLLACYLLQALKRVLADGRRMSMPQNARNIDAAAIPLSEIDVS